MTRNTLLVAAVVVALVLGAVLWFTLSPDRAPEMAEARPVSPTTGEISKKPSSDTQNQGSQPGQGGAGGTDGSGGLRTAELEGETQTAAAAPPAVGAESQAAAEPADEPAAAAPPAASVAPPSFDIVRVQKDGNAVVAGRAEPGSTVQLLDGEAVIAEGRVGSDGTFALVLEEPLAPGTRTLSLATATAEGTLVPSENEVVVVVAGTVAAKESASGAAAAAQQSAEAAVAAVESASEEAAAESAQPSASATEIQPAASAATTDEPAATPEPAGTPPAASESTATESAAADSTAAESTASGSTATGSTASSTESTATESAATSESSAEAASTSEEPGASAEAGGDSGQSQEGATEEQQMADTPSLASQLEAEQDTASASSSETATELGAAQSSEPLVVIQPKSGQGASQVLQGAAPVGGKPTVSIEAVDYDLNGQVVISGRGPAGAQVLLYLDHAVLGQASVAGDGRWQYRPEQNVATGLHRLRADLVGADGSVVARAEIPFQRAAPIQVAADEEFVVVQPGNSLWVIARKRYGEGLQYTAIYEANAAQIRDPDLIYPGQIFLMPSVN
ncbi:MAG TPA: LysM peptidoglycan-binding domain-containing protein [Kiloniellales bacterium]|nr:LysM peptidoglycan-binding domain-containing protein [Kiloniellales bacterium]